ncbi:hypothetical protein V1264_000387 [Littorina saxatilis]
MDRLGMLVFLVLGTIFTLYPSADARMRALPLPRQLKECYVRAQNFTTVNYVGGLYCWYCETPVRSFIKGAPQPLKPQQYAYYRDLYSKVDPATRSGFRGKRQASRCLRKEYRMLTDEERFRFHGAVNALKADTTVEPNKYDALALFHTGVATFVAHGGPGFPGWHRIYLLLFEAALQEMDPTVCVPYWDSSMDTALEHPDQSYIWSNDFFGSWEGEVVAGPFANWQTPEGMGLRRSVGRDGQLFTRESIEAIMSRNTYEEILMPDQDPQYSLEFHHGGTHVFVGGDMERLDTAAFDVIFFLHHAFVDYIWEMFRDKMRNNDLNPEQYPTVGEVSDYHLASAPMGFGNITHAEGYLNALKDSYEYQPAPECSQLNPDCGSKYLWCNVTLARCIPIDPLDPPIVEVGPDPHPAHCPFTKPQSYQNSFCLNGVCDVSQWVWVPVKIVAQRPPEFNDYHSYPVTNGKVSTTDIYEPSSYIDTRRYIKTDKPKPRAYEHCENKDGVGKIFVSSNGVNYDGSYKESAIIDQRLATSIGVTYIAVKDPGVKGVTEVILRAHDQCGRICHTACKIPGSNPSRFEACSGVVEITPDYPRQYGQTYASATLDVYDYASNSDCPSFKTDEFFVTFYCDYRDHLPWVEKPVNTFPGAPPIVVRPTPIVRPASNAGQCRLSSECTINYPCMKAAPTSSPRQCSKEMDMKACMGNCQRYAVCIYGVYWPRKCQSGMSFDELKGRCVRGLCPAQAVTRPSGPFRPRPGTSWAQTHRPSAFGTGSYYGGLINRFGLGKR